MKSKLLFFIVLLAFTNISATFAQDGSLDTNFGTNGKVRTPPPNNTGNLDGYSVALQSDGKIVVGAVYEIFLADIVEIHYEFSLIRYNTDGSLDTSFGTNGKVINSSVYQKNNSYLGVKVKIQSDGKILIVGGSDTNLSTLTDFCVLRYNSNGTLDTSFGTNGLVTTDFNNEINIANSIDIQSDGKIVVGGIVENSLPNFLTDYNFGVVRYNTNGTLDTSFGTGGKLNFNIGTITIDSETVNSRDIIANIKVVPSGKILLSGTTDFSNTSSSIITENFITTRINSNGTLDTSFGTNGRTIVDFNSEDDSLVGLQITSNNKILLGGYSTFNSGSTYKLSLTRLNENGSIDTTFGTNGKSLTQFGAVIYNALPNSFALLPDGKIIVGGFGDSPLNNVNNSLDFYLGRYTENGILDTSFDNDGFVTTNYEDFSTDAMEDIIVQPNGKILAVGSSSTAARNVGVFRYNGATLSTSDFDVNDSFKVFPNPISNEINLNFTISKPQILKFELIDSCGKIIESFKSYEVFDNGTTSLILNLKNNISNGIYFLNIIGEKNRKSIKIIK